MVQAYTETHLDCDYGWSYSYDATGWSYVFDEDGDLVQSFFKKITKDEVNAFSRGYRVGLERGTRHGVAKIRAQMRDVLGIKS